MATGDLHLITHDEQMEQPWLAAKLPRLTFSGAQLGPLVSWNPGDVHAMTIAFYPDAFSAMTGLELSEFTGRMVPAEKVLPLSILDPCLDFFARAGAGNENEDGDVEQSFALLEDDIEVLWTSERAEGFGPTRWLRDWTRSLMAKAALSAPGRSARQIARRVRASTGVTERDLRGLSQSEELYANINKALEKGDLNWARLAATSGFSDQAHMIRRMRRHTGFTPEQLRRGAASDEAFWGYRLLGEYFSKPNS